jgi:hypothetical protein
MHHYRRCLWVTGLALLFLCAGAANAGIPGTYGDGCVGCHGDFNGDIYVSLVDGQSWGTNLMGGHIDILDGDCDTCHTDPSRSPVFLDSSEGGEGLPPISCVGCHGRAEDAGNDDISGGYGAGLRQHHYNAGVTECADCHFDADPGNYRPVKENVQPPYYFTPDSNHPDKPQDPCYTENFIGGPQGLDNDGDLATDGFDEDCQASIPTLQPGAMVIGMLLLLITGVIGLRRRRLG